MELRGVDVLLPSLKLLLRGHDSNETRKASSRQQKPPCRHALLPTRSTRVYAAAAEFLALRCSCTAHGHAGREVSCYRKTASIFNEQEHVLYVNYKARQVSSTP
ncbi:unnamed protein product [Polarella glacialis]|uniref:Uncharacterized protein n=1 Tax=Polarella glacialis TaxID=89957 RepID=A0A813GW47_POLGL|nr:unnamed protein product [Polarella glacialis]